jgi:hypothetical protein
MVFDDYILAFCMIVESTYICANLLCLFQFVLQTIMTHTDVGYNCFIQAGTCQCWSSRL